MGDRLKKSLEPNLLILFEAADNIADYHDGQWGLSRKVVDAAKAELEAIRASNDAEPFGREAERMVVARCIQIIFDIRDEFLSPEYAVDQPLGSLMERVACDLCIDAIGAEFVMSSNEQRILVGRPSHIEEYQTTK